MNHQSDQHKQDREQLAGAVAGGDKPSLLSRILGPKTTKTRTATPFATDESLSPLQRALAMGEAPQSEMEALAHGRPPNDIVRPPSNRKARAAFVMLMVLLGAGVAMFFGLLPNPLATSDTASASSANQPQFDPDKPATFAVSGEALSEYVALNGGFLAPALMPVDDGWAGSLADVLTVKVVANDADEVERVDVRFPAESATPSALVEVITAGLYLGDQSVLAELVDDASRAPTGSVLTAAAMDIHVVADGTDRVLMIVPPGSPLPS